MQAVSGGHIGGVEKQWGLNLQVGGVVILDLKIISNFLHFIITYWFEITSKYTKHVYIFYKFIDTVIALIRVWRQMKGGSYFAENENWPIFMAENGNIAFISTDIIF